MFQHRIFISLLVSACVLGTSAARAQESATPSRLNVAQMDTEDSYDPFADYSEFDQAQEEEEDINFFKNGRFVSIGLIGGYRGFTETLGSLMNGGFEYGLFLAYFFDLRFALQFSFLTGDHAFGFTAPSGSYGGDVGFQDFGINLKYYINTQNVTKGLASFNPYFLIGFSEIFRTINVLNTSAFGKDNATGFNIGGGIELPMVHNKMFYGLQAVYTLVTFPDANSELVTADQEHTGIYPHGNTYTVLAILGINF